MLGGPVFYLGVEVGTVTAMEIIPGNPMRVRVDAEVLKSAPVNNGTYASMAFQGITGVAVIKLNAEPGLHEPLLKGKGDQFPVIPVKDTGFSASYRFTTPAHLRSSIIGLSIMKSHH